MINDSVIKTFDDYSKNLIQKYIDSLYELLEVKLSYDIKDYPITVKLNSSKSQLMYYKKTDFHIKGLKDIATRFSAIFNIELDNISPRESNTFYWQMKYKSVYQYDPSKFSSELFSRYQDLNPENLTFKALDLQLISRNIEGKFWITFKDKKDNNIMFNFYPTFSISPSLEELYRLSLFQFKINKSRPFPSIFNMKLSPNKDPYFIYDLFEPISLEEAEIRFKEDFNEEYYQTFHPLFTPEIRWYISGYKIETAWTIPITWKKVDGLGLYVGWMIMLRNFKKNR